MAAGLQSRYAAGACWVDVTEPRSPGQAAAAAAAALGCGGDRPPIEAVAVCARGLRLLVVLDQGGTVADGLGRLADALLEAGRGVQVLVTSREALRLPGEQVMVVPPMPVPDPGQPARVGAACDAVELFTERASIGLTRDTAPAIGRIVRLLDGIPLGIELAAGAARVLSPAEILERLESRRALLPRGNRDRQEPLRAAVEGSAALCDGGELALWARLGCFEGGFDLEAAEAACADEEIPAGDVLGLLAGLLDKSILTREDPARTAGRVRFRMLATLLEHGRGMLAASGQTAATRARHAAYYRALAARAAGDWFSPRQQDWAARMAREHDNLIAALEHCAAHPTGGGLLGFAADLPWITSGRMSEGLRWIERALSAGGAPTRARPRALHTAAHLALRLGRREQARRLLAEAERLGTKFDDRAALAWVALRRGQAAVYAGEGEEAATLLDSALAAHRGLGEACGVYSALRFRALAAIALGEDSAAGLAAECLELCESHGADLSRSWALWVVGMCQQHAGDLDDAANTIAGALRIKQACSDLPGTAHCLEALAWIAAAGARTPAEHRRAAVLLAAGAATWRRVGCDVAGDALLSQEHQVCEAHLRQALGERAYREASDDGAGWGAQEAVTAALSWVSPTPAGGSGESGELTGREMEVAGLIAEGMTNAEIAGVLYVSPGTVKAHIGSVLTKLGLERRAQIAAWVTRRGG